MERQLIRVASKLSKFDYKVIIISYDNEPSFSFYEIPENIEWIKCGNGLIPHKSAQFIKRIKQIYKLRFFLKKYKVTHLISFHHGILPRSILASLFLPIKNIVSERNSLSNYKYIKLKKYNIGFLSLFLADIITVQLKIYINDYPKLLRKKIKVIPNLLPIKEAYKTPSIEKFVISMMGRLCPQKNFTPLLDQCLENLYQSKNLKIKIAGEGQYRKIYEKKYKKLISLGILELLGNVQDTETFLRSSSIFCFPSLWEGYPNALIEAMAVGLPIVLSSRLKGLNEFVENQYNGFIVDDKDYLNTINKMLNDKDKLRIMSKNSFRKYKALLRYSSIENWINLINS